MVFLSRTPIFIVQIHNLAASGDGKKRAAPEQTVRWRKEKCSDNSAAKCKQYRISMETQSSETERSELFLVVTELDHGKFSIEFEY